MKIKSKVYLKYQPINLGVSLSFIPSSDGFEKDPKKRRIISYYQDEIVPDFPLLVCRDRVRECHLTEMYRVNDNLSSRQADLENQISHNSTTTTLAVDTSTGEVIEGIFDNNNN